MVSSYAFPSEDNSESMWVSARMGNDVQRIRYSMTARFFMLDRSPDYREDSISTSPVLIIFLRIPYAFSSPKFTIFFLMNPLTVESLSVL